MRLSRGTPCVLVSFYHRDASSWMSKQELQVPVLPCGGSDGQGGEGVFLSWRVGVWSVEFEADLSLTILEEYVGLDSFVAACLCESRTRSASLSAEDLQTAHLLTRCSLLPSRPVGRSSVSPRTLHINDGSFLILQTFNTPFARPSKPSP